MIGRSIAIIRINNKKLGDIQYDQERLRELGFQVIYHVPLVQVVRPNREVQLQNLLLNYGFIEAPLEYLRNMNTLTELRQLSVVINSFFWRKGIVHNQLGIEIPVLVETITDKKLSEILEATSRVGESYNSKEIVEGEYLILSDKPFQGVMVQVLSVSKNKIRVKLMISADFTMELDRTYVNFRKVYNPGVTSFAKELAE